MPKSKPKPRKITRHTFDGAKYWVSLLPEGLDGFCVDRLRKDDNLEICIARPLRTKRGLETAIHEAIHAICPKVAESHVTHLGEELADWLWKLDYRTRRP